MLAAAPLMPARPFETPLFEPFVPEVPFVPVEPFVPEVPFVPVELVPVVEPCPLLPVAGIPAGRETSMPKRRALLARTNWVN